MSLQTDDYKKAVLKAAIYDQQIEAFWRSLVDGHSCTDFRSRYKESVKLAKAYGFAYKTIDEVAASPVSEIVERLSVDKTSHTTANALLGGAGEGSISLRECIELFWDLVPERVQDKSEHQIKKWRNPRRAAMVNFIEIVGNKNVQEVNRKDVLAFRHWWAAQLRKGKSANTANKQMHFVRDILQVVSTNNEIDIDFDTLFVKTNFRDEKRSRPPFEASFVQKILLPELHVLDQKDQVVIWAMADTGARVSEIFGLSPDDIRLDCEIPHIWIRAKEGYSLKTRTSERKIPLVGTSLKAFQMSPRGFTQKGNPDVFSTRVNKLLRKESLYPSRRHSIYSLRHTFKDRLRDIEAPEEVIDDLMGHKKSGPKYGRGHRLESKLKWMERIAFDLGKK